MYWLNIDKTELFINMGISPKEQVRSEISGINESYPSPSIPAPVKLIEKPVNSL